MQRIVTLRERDFADKDKYDYAPQNYEDALDSYEQVLHIVGELCGDVIAPNAQNVDQTGPSLVEGRAVYDPYTQANLDAVRQAGLMGIALPVVTMVSTSPSLLTSWQRILFRVAMPALRTYGVCKTAPPPYMNLVAKTNGSASSLVSRQGKLCLWTLPNPMPVVTFRP